MKQRVGEEGGSQVEVQWVELSGKKEGTELGGGVAAPAGNVALHSQSLWKALKELSREG